MVFSKYLERPSLFLLGFGVLTIYIPGIFGAAISTGWLFLLIIIPILLFFYQAKIKDAHIYGLAFLTLASLSLLWTENLNIAIFYLAQLFILGAIFYIGSSIKDLTWVLHGLGLGITVNSIIGVLQYLDINTVYTNGNEIAALLVNRNIFCEISVVLLLTFILFKLWWWIPFTLPGIILVHSKAALLTFGVYIFYLIWQKNKLASIGLVALGVILGFKYINYPTFAERILIWTDTIQGLTIFGSGIGSYEILYPKNATNIDTLFARPKYAHNDLLQILFEHGLFIIPLIAMLANVLSIRSEKQVILWGILFISLFTYPFHVPAMALIWCFIAGRIVADGGSSRIAWNVWGPNLFKSFKRKQFRLSWTSENHISL